MTAINALDFIVKIDDLQRAEFVEKPYSDELPSNQVLLEIDQFSFTSNNITYGVVGEQMNYWKFFPAQPGYGIIPAWGLANIIVSKPVISMKEHVGVQELEKLYLDMLNGKIDPRYGNIVSLNEINKGSYH